MTTIGRGDAIRREATSRVAGFVVISLDGAYVDADEAGLALLGLTLEELRGKRVGDLSAPDSQAAVSAMWRTWVAEDRWPRQLTAVVVQTRQGPTIVNATFVRHDDAVHGELAVVAPDGSGRRTLQQVLMEWRAAERSVERQRDAAERARLQAQVQSLRDEYAELVRSPTAPDRT